MENIRGVGDGPGSGKGVPGLPRPRDSEFRKSALVFLVAAACLAHVQGQPICCFEVASVIGIVSTEFLEMVEALFAIISEILRSAPMKRVCLKIFNPGG